MKGKKSFVAYTDWQAIFNELSDEEAGALIKHIFKYVNDEDPVLENRMLNILFKPIQIQLKRDLQNWNDTKEKRSEAGRLGGQAKASNAKQILANASNAKQNLANLAVNVNVNDNVNDINNNSHLRYSKFIADVNNDINNFKKVLEECIKKKPKSIEQLLMNNKIEPLNEIKNKIWLDFLKNATIHTPQIEDEKHAWNIFKLFVEKNAKNYKIKSTLTVNELE
jgi:hypothetical protein